MSSLTEEIRSYASEKISQARRNGYHETTLIAGALVKELNLSNRTPSVCSALTSKKFLDENHIQLKACEGPASGRSTTMRYTYRILNPGMPIPAGATKFSALKGAGAGVFEAEGGGTAHLHGERGDFYSR